MISTIEIVILAFLLIVLGIATWWFVIAFKYGKNIKNYSYTQGANIDPGIGKSKGITNLGCDSDHEICVWRATAQCTGGDASNFEISNQDPISKDGTFNILEGGASDLTPELASLANGQSFYSYTFDGSKHLPKCSGPTARAQLVATYTCIPKGEKCVSYVAKK